jgi:hypothetical protein
MGSRRNKVVVAQTGAFEPAEPGEGLTNEHSRTLVLQRHWIGATR